MRLYAGSFAALRRHVDLTYPHVWYSAEKKWYGVIFRDRFGDVIFAARKLPFEKHYSFKYKSRRNSYAS